MNIELKPIAESKVRQLGGDVCGVLVRTQDSEVMAVSEHGRGTRLDAEVMGPVEPAGMSDRDEFEKQFPVPLGVKWCERQQDYTYENYRALDSTASYSGKWQAWQAARAQGDAEPVAWTWLSGGRHVTADKPFAEQLKADGIDVRPLYTRPPSAGVPESIEVAIDMLEDYASALGNGDLDGAGHSTTACVHEVIDQLATAPQPPQPAVPEGWKLVPVEPTIRQIYAAEFPIDDVVSMRQSSQHAIAIAAYKAMIDAAPQPPKQEGDQ